MYWRVYLFRDGMGRTFAVCLYRATLNASRRRGFPRL